MYKNNVMSYVSNKNKTIKPRFDPNQSSSLEPIVNDKNLDCLNSNKMTKYLAINITGTRRNKLNCRKSTSPTFSNKYSPTNSTCDIEVVNKGYSPRKGQLTQKYVKQEVSKLKEGIFVKFSYCLFFRHSNPNFRKFSYH